MTAIEKWTDRWAWMTAFPTTNAMSLLSMWLLFAVVIVPLAMMLTGHKDQLDGEVIAMLLGGVLGGKGIASYQKVKKWKEMPDSAIDEPPPPPTAEHEAREAAKVRNEPPAARHASPELSD